jgi:hypothetical protein
VQIVDFAVASHSCTIFMHVCSNGRLIAYKYAVFALYLCILNMAISDATGFSNDGSAGDIDMHKSA